MLADLMKYFELYAEDTRFFKRMETLFGSLEHSGLVPTVAPT